MICAGNPRWQQTSLEGPSCRPSALGTALSVGDLREALRGTADAQCRFRSRPMRRVPDGMRGRAVDGVAPRTLLCRSG